MDSQDTHGSNDAELTDPGYDIEQFEDKLRDERLRRAVRRALDAEEQPVTPIPTALTLQARLKLKRPEVLFRVMNWLPADGKALLVAQFKCGKTTLVGNLIRSLLDGDDFLGHSKVAPVRSVALLDFEMSERQLENWLADQGIRRSERLHIFSLRGSASAFNILDPAVRAAWAQQLRDVNADFVVLDCLRPVLDALALDEHKDAGKFFVAFDELLKLANVSEALLVHHSGHEGTRSRGDSRILDWPDTILNLRRESKDDFSSPRYLVANGRDVAVEEGKLIFEATTRHLTFTQVSRKESQGNKHVHKVLELLASAEAPLSGRELAALMKDFCSKEQTDAAIELAVKQELVARERMGGNKGNRHSLTDAGKASFQKLPEAVAA